MSRPEDQRRLLFTQGATAVELFPDHLRISTRGATIQFSTIDDFMTFLTDLGIIAVQIDQALPERNRGQSEHTDDDEPKP